MRSDFYIKDFDNFSAQELYIIEKLVLYSQSVTVSSTYYSEQSHSMLYLNEVFASVSAMAQRLIREARMPAEKFDTVFGNINDDHTLFMQKYFMSALTPDEKRILPDKYTLYNGSTPSDEVKGLARYIAERLASGERPDSFTVIMSDKNRYKAAINAVFPEFEIPYFLDDGVTLFDTPLGQFTTLFFRLQEEYSTDRVMSFAESFFFGTENDDICIFENYINKYNCRITDKPFAYDKASENYVKIDGIRQKIIDLIGEPLPKKAFARIYTEAARRLLTDCDAIERSTILSELLRQADLRSASYRSEQVPDKLYGILDSIESILGDTELELEVFSEILSKGMLATDLSLIPITANCVEFIEMAKARRHTYENIAILGANEGVFPIIKGDFKLLSDENLEILAAAGADIRPSVKALNQRELFDIYQLFLEPCKSLRISYSSISPLGGKLLEPSVCIKGIYKLFVGSDGLQPVPQTRPNESILACPNRKSALLSLKERISDCFAYDRPIGKQEAVLYYLSEKPDIRTLIAPPPPDSTVLPEKVKQELSRISASRIECFYSCPFKHFLRYEMKLKPRQSDEEPSAAIIGTIVHEVLEKGLLPYTRNREFSETEDEIIKRSNVIFDEALSSDEYLRSFLAVKKNQAILKKLKAECSTSLLTAIRQIQRSDFKPAYLEKRFGRSAEISTKYGKSAITGIIDRIDSNGKKAIVIDYKTGSTEFKDDDLYKGTRLQLTTYLTALKNDFDTVGLYYMRLNDKYRKDSERTFSYSGLTLNDLQTVKEIDNTLYSEQKSLRLGIELKNDGEIKAKGSIISEEEFIAYERYTSEMYKNAIESCYEGYIAPSPVKNACELCDYQSICPFNDRARRPER